MPPAVNRWGGVGEGWRGAAEGEPSGPVISPSESEERGVAPPHSELSRGPVTGTYTTATASTSIR